MSVRLQSMVKTYGKVTVIRDVNLSIKKGEFVVFVGPSGCGKSTLLRMIAGLETITSGRVLIDDKDVSVLPPSQRSIAMVFQSYALYPHLSVFENMAFSLRIARLPKTQIEQRVKAAADILQLSDYLHRLPKSLSGGQRQRVAIGRAIVRKPKVFLFDEPLSNLDAALRSATRFEIAKLHASMPDATMIYVTHDQVEAMTLANRIVVLNAGHIEQVGTPMTLYNCPKTPFVAEFIGNPKMNMKSGILAKRYGAESIGVRPEHIYISTSPDAWGGVVQYIENLGADSIIYIDTDDYGDFVVRLNGASPCVVGDRVSILPQEGNVHCFRDGYRV